MYDVEWLHSRMISIEDASFIPYKYQRTNTVQPDIIGVAVALRFGNVTSRCVTPSLLHGCSTSRLFIAQSYALSVWVPHLSDVASNRQCGHTCTCNYVGQDWAMSGHCLIKCIHILSSYHNITYLSIAVIQNTMKSSLIKIKLLYHYMFSP